ncbi:MAG: hypothetical protein ACOC8K_03300 [Gemmatimonadota bacterium]
MRRELCDVAWCIGASGEEEEGVPGRRRTYTISRRLWVRPVVGMRLPARAAHRKEHSGEEVQAVPATV